MDDSTDRNRCFVRYRTVGGIGQTFYLRGHHNPVSPSLLVGLTAKSRRYEAPVYAAGAFLCVRKCDPSVRERQRDRRLYLNPR